MKNHFRGWWGAYLVSGIVIAYICLMVVGSIDDDHRESRCLKAGYHYVDHECYKVIIPAEWEN